jgi:hypothetical protein
MRLIRPVTPTAGPGALQVRRACSLGQLQAPNSRASSRDTGQSADIIQAAGMRVWTGGLTQTKNASGPDTALASHRLRSTLCDRVAGVLQSVRRMIACDHGRVARAKRDRAGVKRALEASFPFRRLMVRKWIFGPPRDVSTDAAGVDDAAGLEVVARRLGISLVRHNSKLPRRSLISSRAALERISPRVPLSASTRRTCCLSVSLSGCSNRQQRLRSGARSQARGARLARSTPVDTSSPLASPNARPWRGRIHATGSPSQPVRFVIVPKARTQLAGLFPIRRLMFRGRTISALWAKLGNSLSHGET